MAFGAGSARVFLAVQWFLAGFGDVGVQDFVAVDVDGYFVAVDSEFFVVPLADGAEIASEGGGQAVEAAVGLVGVKPTFVFLVAIVEDLRFHAFVGDILFGDRGAEAEAVVARRVGV